MKSTTLSVKIRNPIGNLYRKKHTLILIESPDGRFVLGQKNGFYPDNIARMIGGGIKEHEQAIEAATREIQEELGLTIAPDRLRQLTEIRTDADTTEGKMSMTTYTFYLAITQNELSSITPSDDITGIHTYSAEEVKVLIEYMRQLFGTYSGTSGSTQYTFDWGDWGSIYAPIHEIALTEK